MKNIAVLFVGRSNQFPAISGRLKKAFEESGHTYYFFGHTWNDDFLPLDRNDDLAVFRQKLISVNTDNIKSALPFCKFETSSYNKVLDLIDEVNFDIPRLKTMFLAYVAQFYSLNEAAQIAFDFSKTYNIHYDAVIKWRFDLAADSIELLFNDVVENVLYVDTLGSNLGVNDQCFYGAYRTMEIICTGYRKFLSIFLESVYRVYYNNPDHNTIVKLVEQDKIMFSERMFRNMCCDLVPEITFDDSPDKLIHSCLIKEGCDPTWSIKQLEYYNNNTWDGQGWDNKILINKQPIGPTTSNKIKL
jgi:hypothetical protein